MDKQMQKRNLLGAGNQNKMALFPDGVNMPDFCFSNKSINHDDYDGDDDDDDDDNGSVAQHHVCNFKPSTLLIRRPRGDTVSVGVERGAA